MDLLYYEYDYEYEYRAVSAAYTLSSSVIYMLL